MSVFHQNDRDYGRLEDLDVAATAYAQDWMNATLPERIRLRDDMICRCLPFAGRMAKRYGGRGESLEDLQQVARLGLIKAVDRFDPERGSFTAFAVITICGEIKRHFRDRTWGLHVNRRLQDLALDLQHATVALTHQLARTPSVAELAVHLRVSEAEVRRAQQCAAGHTPVPLSAPAGAEGTRELGDVVGETDDALETLTDKLAAAELVQLLPDRIQRMMAMRFYGNLTQAQIAAEFGVSQMQVSRLLSRALSWLRAAMLSDVPPPWTGAEDCSSNVHVRIEKTSDAVDVVVSGEVDRDNADRLRLRLHTAVAMAAKGPVIIDVTGVPFIDAAGAAVLRDACVAANLAGATVTFCGVQPYVRPVLAAFGVPAPVRS